MLSINNAQLHLLLNHIPVFLPILGAITLVFSVIRKSKDLKNLSLGFFLIAALSAIPTYMTGTQAEQVVKNYPGILRTAIKKHEEMALLSLVALESLGVLSLWLSIKKPKTRSSTGRVEWGVLLVLACVSFFLTAKTAHLGGLIRHEEIQTFKDE